MRTIPPLYLVLSILLTTGCNGYPQPLDPKSFDHTSWKAQSPYDAQQHVEFSLRRIDTHLALYGRGGCQRLMGMLQITGNRISLKTPLVSRAISDCHTKTGFMTKRYINAIKKGLIYDSDAFYTSDGQVKFSRQAAN